MMIEKIRTLSEFYDSPTFFLWKITHKDEEIHPCYGCPEIMDSLEKVVRNDNELCSYANFESFINDIKDHCTDICSKRDCHEKGLCTLR